MNIPDETLKPYRVRDGKAMICCDASGRHEPPFYQLGDATHLCRACLDAVLYDALSILQATGVMSGDKP
jgi:hypothetical protein